MNLRKSWVLLLAVGLTGCVDSPEPVVDEPKTVVEKPQPIVNEPRPVAKKPEPVVEDSEPPAKKLMPKQPSMDGLIDMDEDGNLIRPDQPGDRGFTPWRPQKNIDQPEPSVDEHEERSTESSLLKMVGQLRSDGFFTDSLAVQGQYVYLASGPLDVRGKCAYLVKSRFLRVVDVSDPTKPTVVGTFSNPKYSPPEGDDEPVTSEELDAINPADVPGFQVVDVSDPFHPTLVGTCGKLEDAWVVTIGGHHAYVLCEGLSVVDISNPKAPTVVGTCHAIKGAQGIAVAGDYAYVATDFDGLQIVDIANPKAPKVVGFCRDIPNPISVALSENLAYVGDQENTGMWVLDVSDPKAPKRVSQYSDGDNIPDLAVADKYAYLSSCGLDVVDISDPATPRRVEYHEERVDCIAGQVAVSGDYVYLSHPGSGKHAVVLSIFSITKQSKRSATSEKQD